MRIADHPTREIHGVAYHDTPLTQKDDPRALLTMAAATLTRLDALEGLPERTPGLAAAFDSLRGLLAGCHDLDLDDLDDPRVGHLAGLLAIWHEIVWYPKGNELGDEWSGRPDATEYRKRHHGTYLLEKYVLHFCDDIPEQAANHGFETRAWEDKLAVARLMEGRKPAEILKDKALLAEMTAAEDRRKLAESDAQDLSVADLVAQFDAEMANLPPPGAAVEPSFSVAVRFSRGGADIATEDYVVSAADEEAARAAALDRAGRDMFSLGEVPDQVTVDSVRPRVAAAGARP